MRYVCLLAIGCGAAPDATLDAPPPDRVDAGTIAPPRDCGPVTPNESTAGVIETVLADIDGPTGFTLDATHLYFVHGRGNIARIARTGGPIEPIASEQRSPGALDATTDRLCWANGGTHSADFVDGSIRCASKTGGNEVELSTAYMPGAMVIEGGTAFWVEIDGHAVRSIDLDGGNPRTLDTSYTHKTNLAVTPTKLAWAASGSEADVVAMDRGTSTVTPLTSSEYSPTGLVIDADDVFWAVQHDLSSRAGSLRVSRAGAAPTDLVASECAPSGLVRAGGSLYWTSWDRIRTTSTSGGTPVTLAVNQGLTIGGLVVDGDFLYWSELYRGTIVRMRL